MLTLKRCREILGDDWSKSDAELELLRDRLYNVARVAVDACPRHRCGKGPRNAPDTARQAISGVARMEAPSKPAGYSDMLATLSDEGRSEVEERAAIMEFDAGLGRDAAERAAFCLYRQAK